MRRLLAAVIAVIAAAALGVLLGWLWESLAPRVSLVIASDGQPYPEGYQPEGYMTDDGIAALLCIGAGLVVGLVAVWVSRRVIAPGHALAVALVSVLVLGAIGSIALWRTGETLGAFDFDALVAASAEGDVITAPLRLRMPGVLVLWPLASVIVVFLAALADWLRGRSQERIDALA
ncbi:MAG: hypothetical protein RL347_1796 [Actinomycetota bacterium]|jgi:hypothetical protein